MRVVLFKILLSLGLVGVAAFACFGLVASFEPLPAVTQWMSRVLYASALGASGWGIARLWRRSAC
jgi:hypothetical protein